ncbi:cytoskeleton-associated protein 2-like [Scyliorhinus torazame]|uniref:cytoskeleton-associated protein 2-like n=1 Tax=Scyliorhinus torazame TaxID=75743 RepID=UPI003B5AA5A3
MTPVPTPRTLEKPLSYEEQKRKKLEDYVQRKKSANNVAIQARSRLESRVYLRDKTNFEKLQASKWQTEAKVSGGAKIESNETIQNILVQNKILSLSSTPSKSMLSTQRANLFIENTNSATSETEMPGEQIVQPEQLLASAQENSLKVEQKLSGNSSVAIDKTQVPGQQSVESKKLPFDQKKHSDMEQKAKLKSPPKVQKVTLSQSFLAVKNERARLMSTAKNNKPKPPNSTFKKPVPGSFRGKIVESKVQSFRPGSHQKERKPEKSDPGMHASGAATHNTESRGTLHKPRPNGVENMHPVRRTLNVMSHSKQKSLTAAPGLRTASSQKPLETDVLNIKIDFKTSGNGDAAIVATQTISAKKTIAPFPNSSKSAPARHPAWKLSAVGNNKPMKQKGFMEEKSGAQPASSTASKGKLTKRPTTSLQRKKVEEEPVKSLWTTIVEEENQSELESKINQTLSECLKRIHEGCPSEDCFQTLQTFIESVPKAKKFARYWICLAQLEQRKGSVHDVMTIYEQAIKIGAQPAEELRNTLADILKNTKTPKKPHDGTSKTDRDGAQKDPKLATYCASEQEERGAVVLEDNEGKTSQEENVNCTNDKKGLPLDLQEICIAATGQLSRENEGDLAIVPCNEGADLTADGQQLHTKQKVQPTTGEQQSPSVERVADEADGKEGFEVETKENDGEGTCEIEIIKAENMKTPLRQILTPSKIENRGSSVKYSVRATPSSIHCPKSAVQMEMKNSVINDLKFLTPVRRSRRIEHVSSQLPLMLQDHDPCVSSLEDLKNLGEGSTAFSFRMNSALPE